MNHTVWFRKIQMSSLKIVWVTFTAMIFFVMSTLLLDIRCNISCQCLIHPGQFTSIFHRESKANDTALISSYSLYVNSGCYLTKTNASLNALRHILKPTLSRHRKLKTKLLWTNISNHLHQVTCQMKLTFRLR